MKAIYYCILFVLGFIAIIGIFSEPEPALDMVRWTAVFVISKSVGFAAGYIAYRLMVRWVSKRSFDFAIIFALFLLLYS